MLELASEIIKLANSSSEIAFKPLPSDDPKDRRPDISKAKALLSWEPRITRESGLVKAINFFASKIL